MDALVSLFELGGLLQGVKYGGISAEMVENSWWLILLTYSSPVDF